MKWSTVLPVGKATLDGRVIHGLLLERGFPLRLMVAGVGEEYRLGTMPVGQVDYANVGRKTLWLGGTMWTPGSRPPGYADPPMTVFTDHPWYAVCDLTDTLVQPYHRWFRQYLQMNGTLAGMTLVGRPSWRRQQPVTFTP